MSYLGTELFYFRGALKECQFARCSLFVVFRRIGRFDL